MSAIALLMARRGPVAATACLIVAAGFTAKQLTGAHDPVAMPTTPAPVTAVGALVAAALVLAVTRAGTPPSRSRIVALALAGVVMLAGSLFALPHTVLMLIVWVGAGVTGGTGSFEVQPAWAATTTHLVNLIAVVAVAACLLLERRRRRDRCLWCGRVEAAPATASSTSNPEVCRRLRILAGLAIAAALPYAALKISWSLGSRIGLVGNGFDDADLASPGFGDTVVLTGISVAACLVMGAGLTGTSAGRRWLRGLTTAVGFLGSLMLLPVGITATAMLVPLALGQLTIDDDIIATWAFAIIYLGFLAWGLALAALTADHWRATRPACRHHARRDAHPHDADAPGKVDPDSVHADLPSGRLCTPSTQDSSAWSSG